MRYVRFITIISLLFASIHARACAPEVYAPSEYYFFHLVGLPDNPYENFNLNSTKNCQLWQQQTSTAIPLSDIYKLVYKSDIETLTELKSKRIPQDMKDNKMAYWLIENDDQNAIDFLLLAKNCEWLRRESLSPWYYPSKNDPVKYSLNDIAEIARQRAEGLFADRYALQAVRAMTSLKQYQEIIDYWGDIEKDIPEGFLRQMILSYVAGAHIHLGDIEQGQTYFKMANDIKGLLECDQRYREGMSRIEKMEILYENYPDCPDFRLKIWNILGEIEPDRNWTEDWRWEWDGQREEITQLAKLCDRVLSENTIADKALWAYTATYIAHLQGDDKKADQYLKTAEKTVKDQELADAVKAMRVFIDAQICPYDKAYEQKLFAQLRWFQDMIEHHLDERKHNKYYDSDDDYDLYDLNSSISFYYWNDAMRCILLGTVCPKMLEVGKTTLALQMANMASYSWLNLTTDMESYRRNSPFNYYDYSNHFASMMDKLSANDLIAYLDIAQKPQTDFQRFLNAHSFIGNDYLKEIIGTHCLREMRYAEAENYLSQVAPDYFIRTNVYIEGCLKYDPFNLKMRPWSHSVDAKLYFAKTMNRLEKDIAAAKDPNQKALMMIDFGIGMRNSFDKCWALTQYGQGNVFSDWYEEDDVHNEFTHEAIEYTEKIFSEALGIITNDEYAAQAQLTFCNFKTVRDRYPETLAGYFVKGRCDKVRDYHAEKNHLAYLKE